MMITMKPEAKPEHIKSVREKVPEGFRHHQYDGGGKVIVYIEDYGKQDSPDPQLFKGMDMVEIVSTIRVSLPDRLLQSTRVS